MELGPMRIMKNTCDWEIRTSLHCTWPVHKVWGYRADVGAGNKVGNTPLHFVLAKKNMKPLSQWTPHLNKVRVV